ncbi:MAG: dihydropteroate synthase [Betaproteobacteria bacterium]|nr:MAG: dihydropteroate synthase [Betaproteobacteria bacterium]
MAAHSEALVCGRYRLSLDRPLVMGVLNITPDSFADGGVFLDRRVATDRVRQMLGEGADIVDIGGESTRPGAVPTPESHELDRVIPLLENIRPSCDARGVPISVDTRKPVVMRAAIAAGASMINDINALRATGAIEALSEGSAAVCLMHMQGEPATMQYSASYEDVVADVAAFLAERASACLAAGIDRHRIVLDPGFGFGKTVEHNLTLLRRLTEIAALGYPLLAGLSRKSTIGVLTGRNVDDRMAGSVAAALAAVARGVAIVRVHDVRETADALKVWRAVEGEQPRVL